MPGSSVPWTDIWGPVNWSMLRQTQTHRQTDSSVSAHCRASHPSSNITHTVLHTLHHAKLMSTMYILQQKNNPVGDNEEYFWNLGHILLIMGIVGIMVVKPASTWVKKVRLPCWPASVTPEVNLRNPLHTGNKAHPGFETQSRCHQKSKAGVLVAPQKVSVSSKTFYKNLLIVGCSLAIGQQTSVNGSSRDVYWFDCHKIL